MLKVKIFHDGDIVFLEKSVAWFINKHGIRVINVTHSSIYSPYSGIEYSAMIFYEVGSSADETDI